MDAVAVVAAGAFVAVVAAIENNMFVLLILLKPVLSLQLVLLLL